MSGHVVTLTPRTRRYLSSRLPAIDWRAECSCGAHSDWVSAAGMCHGWEAQHIERQP